MERTMAAVPEAGRGGGGRIEAIEALQVSEFGTNCYLLKVDSGGVACVDPGGEAERIARALRALGGTVEYILCTHGHLDHVEAAGRVRDAVGGRIVLHGADRPLWDDLRAQAGLFGLPPPPALPDPDIVLSSEETLALGPVEIAVRHVPGHSPGGVAYVLAPEGLAFNGDTVFSVGVGRTDLWGGDPRALRASVVEKLFSLPDELVLHPGHGPPVRVKEARRNVPLLELWG
jgi:glyoxylase-like metal-dependent hydrolase (beta-lactamase superfamily II)